MKLTKSKLKQIISEVIAELASESADVMSEQSFGQKFLDMITPDPPDVMRKGPLPHDPEMGIPMNSPRRKTADAEARVTNMAKRMRRAAITGRLPIDPTKDRYERERLRRARVDRAKFARQGGGGVYDGDRPGRLEGKVSYVLDNAQTSDPKVRRSVMRIIKDLQSSAKTSPKAQTFLDLLQQEVPELISGGFKAVDIKAPYLKESTLKRIIKEELEKIISDQQTLEEQIKYTEKRVKLGTTKGGRPRMGFAYTASFGGVSATGQPARDVVGAKRNAYLALMNKTAKPAAMPGVRPQKGSGTPAKMPPVPKTGSPARGMSVDAAGKPTGSGASTDLMQAKPAPMPQVKPEDSPAKPAPMPGGGKFMGLGTTSILKKLFPNDKPKAAYKKLLRLPRKHPAREAYRTAYRKKDRS